MDGITAIMHIKTLASYARSPSLNHISGLLFTDNKTSDEFKNRAKVSLNETETLRSVRVLYLSALDSLLITNSKSSLMITTAPDAAKDIILATPV